MRRAVAHAVLLVCSFGCQIGMCFGADLNSSWKPVGQAKVKKKIRATVPFRPELSLAENNQRLREHRQQSVVLAASVAVDEVADLHLVNRGASWQFGEHTFLGRVTAVMLSGDQSQVTIFAEITDPEFQSYKWTGQEAGLLRVED